MPGIWGAIGCSPALDEALGREFSLPWAHSEQVHLAEGILGGHAFGSSLAVYAKGTDLHFAVDGEASLYDEAQAFAHQGRPALFQLCSGKLELTAACKGNVAVVDSQSRTWYLAAEWTGTFPLYYAQKGGEFIFSSRLRPLARVVSAAPDPIGITEFVQRGYTFSDRTHYQGIRRLLPGQVVTYEPHRQRLGVHETSLAWASTETRGLNDVSYAAEAAWDALKGAVRRCLEPEGKHAIMLSAGWDSRLLLLAMLEHLGPDHLVAYSYGDPRCRELQIAAAICRSLGVAWRSTPLDEALYDLDLLQQGFDRVEGVMYPHWHRAGRLLADEGVTCVSAGLYGAVLGGHFGPPTLLRGSKKIAAVMAALLGRPSGLTGRSKDLVQNVYEFLRYRELRKPAGLSRSFWESLSSPTEAVNADIARTLHRFEQRGIATADQLIEAFLAENRATRYTNTQLLSCRSVIDIAMPLSYRDLLVLASQIPQTTKICNALNRYILQLHAPDLLRFPTAATLVHAGMPIFVQEASRVSRKLFDQGLWKLYIATHGWIRSSRRDWSNFEFLRNGKALYSLVDDLKSDIWDKGALKRIIADDARFSSPRYVHPRPLLMVYATDLMLR